MSLWIPLRRASQERARDRRARWALAFERHFAYVLTVPTLAVLLLVVIFPLAYSFYLSLTDYHLMKPTWHFVGIQQYLAVVADPYFLQALRSTLVFTIASVSVEIILGLAIALLLHRSLQAADALRTLFMIPMMTAPILAGFQFRWFFNDQFGLLNNLLLSLGVIRRPIAWLVEGSLPMSAVIAASAWQFTPFVALVLLAGLTALPREPFEAAGVDGANSWQQFRHITFPLLLPLILLVLSIRLVDAPRTFDLIQIMTQGGPARQTEVLMIHIYRAAWERFEFGHAAAVSYLIVLMQMAFLALQVRFVWKVRAGR